MDLDALVDELADRLGRAVSVEDRRWRLLAYSAQESEVDAERQASILRRRASPEVAAWLDGLGLDAARGPVAVPANPALGMAARTCAPLRDDAGVLHGFAWVLGDADHAVLAEEGPRLGAALGRRRRGLGERLAEALEGDAEAARALAQTAGWTGPVVVAVAAPGTTARLPVVAVEQDDRTVLAGPGAAGMARSGPVEELAEGLRQAEVAALVARADPRVEPAYDRLGAWATVAELWLAAGRPPAPPALDGLRDDLAEALEAVLEAGDVSAAASALHLHRATLYRRLERVEALTGLDLDRGDDRLQAHLGLRLRRLSRAAG